MSNEEYSDLILTERRAEAAHKADPANGEKFLAYRAAYQAARRGLDARQRQSYAAQHPTVQFERVPDEGLL
jgi:hypothetical protein